MDMVGLVSGAEFRVPGPAVRATFGSGTLSLPLAISRARVAAQHAGELPARRLMSWAGAPVPTNVAVRAQAVLDEEDALTSLHRLPVTPVERPDVRVADRTEVDADAIRVERRSAARAGIRWFDVAKLRKADRSASAEADHEIYEALSAVEEAAEEKQQRLEEWWSALNANDPAVVIGHLGRQFAGRDLPATPLAVHGSYAEIAVLAPDEHVLPADAVTMHSGQGLAIRRASGSHRGRFFRQVLAGTIILVVREAFAASPGLDTIRVVTLKASHRGFGDDLSAVAVVELSRRDLAEADLGLDAETILVRHGTALQWDVHEMAGTLRPMLLENVPEVAELLARLCSARYDEPRVESSPAVLA